MDEIDLYDEETETALGKIINEIGWLNNSLLRYESNLYELYGNKDVDQTILSRTLRAQLDYLTYAIMQAQRFAREAKEEFEFRN